VDRSYRHCHLSGEKLRGDVYNTMLCQVSHIYCLQCVDIPDNKAHYFGEKGEIIFHLDFFYHTSGV